MEVSQFGSVQIGLVKELVQFVRPEITRLVITIITVVTDFTRPLKAVILHITLL